MKEEILTGAEEKKNDQDGRDNATRSLDKIGGYDKAENEIVDYMAYRPQPPNFVGTCIRFTAQMYKPPSLD